MPLGPAALGSGGSLHGGAVAVLCDVSSAWAARVAARRRLDAVSLVTADLAVRFLTSPQGQAVHARATVIRNGGRMIVVECKVSDDQDGIVAIATAAVMAVPYRGATT